MITITNSESWYQNPTHVFITLFAKNLKDENVRVHLEPTLASATLQMQDSSICSKDWKLFGTIVEGESKHEVNPFKVEITLKVT
jgi:hypothetical protein